MRQVFTHAAVLPLGALAIIWPNQHLFFFPAQTMAALLVSSGALAIVAWCAGQKSTEQEEHVASVFGDRKTA